MTRTILASAGAPRREPATRPAAARPFGHAGSRPRAYLAANGDPNDPVTWSGTPYHFLEWARTEGLLDEGLPLVTGTRLWTARRLAWNMGRVIRGDRLGGYQYSQAFLDRLWAPFTSRLPGSLVVNCFQLFPPSVVRDPRIEKWYFIDQTLLQLFDYYQLRSTIGEAVARDAVAREREGYHAAAGVITHSRWAATSIAHDYGVTADRIWVAVPGANIRRADYERWDRAAGVGREPRLPGPLRLVFVGKDWRRKGLDRLVAGLTAARRSGFEGTLRVIGCPREAVPSSLGDAEGVEWIGFVDKQHEADRFLAIVSSADVGCLLSRAEAGGMALREYHALGLVTLATDAGGAPEHAMTGASVPVPTNAGTEDIARTLLTLERDPVSFGRLREVAWSRRREALWSTTVRTIEVFWPHVSRGTA